MLNYESYKPTMKYPSKEDFETFNVYKEGKVLVTNGRFSDVANFFEKLGISKLATTDLSLKRIFGLMKDNGYLVESVVDQDAFKNARHAYQQHEQDLINKFAEDLYRFHGVENSPKRDKAFSIAWARGHAYGFNDVASVFEDLVELIVD